MNMQGNLGRNIPQTAPQGIAALQGMQRPQQPQQQGPQGLQNIPQDLMRALGVRAALEAEEEAKKQIAAMTQQALDQQIPQTPIAQQDFEKLKTSKLAEMTGQIGNQQAAKQQQAMQQLMAGIARAPGAGDGFARMAGGGIVAFQEGGEASFIDRLPKEALLRKLRDWIAAGRPPAEKPVIDVVAEALKRKASEPSESDLQDLMPTRQPLPQTPLPPEMGVGQPQAPAMRMPPAQVRSKVPAGVAGAVQQPVVRPDSTGQGISPPQQVAQQAAPSYTQDLMEALGKYQGQEFENMSKLAKELYALPPEVRQIYEQRLAQAKQPKDLVTRLAQLGGYGPEKSVASAYNKMMANERAGIRLAEDALLQAQETARLESAKTALGARGKAAETFGTMAGVGERARATDVSADVARLDRESQERRLDRQIEAQRELKQMEVNNPEWKSKLEYALKNPQAAALMFPKGDKAALDYLKLQVDLKQSQMQSLANDLSPDAAERKKVLAAEVATLSRALGELSGVPLTRQAPAGKVDTSNPLLK